MTERGLIRRYYNRPPQDQILVTFGLGIMIVEAVRYGFGGLSQRVAVPDWGQGVVNFGYFFYPLYRVEAIGIVVLILLALYLLLYRTSVGLIVQDPQDPNALYVGTAENGLFFTYDYYDLIKRHLKPGGMMVQWIPIYYSARDFLMILRAFTEVFPQAVLWFFPATAGSLV